MEKLKKAAAARKASSMLLFHIALACTFAEYLMEIYSVNRVEFRMVRMMMLCRCSSKGGKWKPFLLRLTDLFGKNSVSPLDAYHGRFAKANSASSVILTQFLWYEYQKKKANENFLFDLFPSDSLNSQWEIFNFNLNFFSVLYCEDINGYFFLENSESVDVL